MKKIMITFMAAVCAAAGMSCSHKNSGVTDNAGNPGNGSPAPEAVEAPVRIVGGKPAVVLKASAFRMNGDYSDKVAVTVGNDGELIYYPAPTDITENSKPLDLGGGWWLNRQGLSANSVFTRYSFEEYSALKNVPSREKLKEMIIPGSKVTAFEILPVPASKALNELDAIKEYLHDK